MKIALLIATSVATPAALAASAGAPITVQKPVVTYGEQVTLSGTVASGQAGQPLVVLSKEYGEKSFGALALLTTGSGGSWSTRVQPTIRTQYEAMSGAEQAGPVAVEVKPRVTLARRHGGFVVRVVSNASYQRHYVLLQRRTRHGWKKIGKVLLRRQPRRFQLPLPHGVFRVRAFLPRRQAGAGYAASASAPLRVRR